MKYCSVTDHIFEIMRSLEEANKKPKDYGNGVVLGYAELQFLETVFRYPNEHATELSNRLNITKGAVTQMVAKLSTKGLITITQREHNRQKKFYSPTVQGEQMIQHYQRHHYEANQKLCTYMATLDDKEAQAVYSFLSFLKENVPFCEFPCECNAVSEQHTKEFNYDSPHAPCRRSTCYA
ncbi:MAG: MarR family winged helix-turn-helix transcriptional regulator [Sphaerochaetaceae bacterium]|jgi:DNA-binding MarR family transcriptional regulator